MPEPDPFILQTLERILEAEWDASAAADADKRWSPRLWEVLEETGLPLTWVDEKLGGGGFAMADGFGIVRVAARHAAPIPLADTLLAAWTLAQAGIAMPRGAMGVAIEGVHGQPDMDDDTVSGRLERIAFAEHLQHLVVIKGTGQGVTVALLPMGVAQIADGHGPGGEHSGRFELVCASVAQLMSSSNISVEELVRLGAALRVQQMAGALESILGRTVSYAREREQFGRPIAKFQAVQHNLAQLAGEVAAGASAADGAASAIENYGLGDERTLFAVASAKVRCGEAATTGAGLAHQVHGAMGFAAEYPLHLYTKSLWSWRDDFGSETEWAERLGSLACSQGGDGYWPFLTSV